MERHTDYAVAFSDWEAGKKKRELRRIRREKKKSESDIMVAAEKSAAISVAPEKTETKALETKSAAGTASSTASSIKDKGFALPWPGQNIVFDLDVAREKGYVASEQTVLSGVKGYTFFNEDGTGRFMRPEMLITLKLAHKM